MKTRVTVSGLIYNSKGEVLLCKMPLNRGAYPGQWAIPGGGMEEGEKVRETLVRELREEVGLEVEKITTFGFEDDVREKLMVDGTREKLYMIHLVCECWSVDDQVKINEEFEAYAWVKPAEIKDYDLNEATVKTMKRRGFI